MHIRSKGVFCKAIPTVFAIGFMIFFVFAATFIQQAPGNGGKGGGVTMTFPSPVTTGNSVLVEVSSPVGSPVTAMTCNSGALTLTKADETTGSTTITSVWYAHNVTGGFQDCRAITTVSAGGNAQEFNGLKNAAPVTADNSGNDAAPTTGTVTPATPTNVVVAGNSWNLNSYSSGPSNSFTRLTATAGNVGVFQEAAYLIQTTPANASTAYVLTGTLQWANVIVAFQAFTVGPSATQASAGFWMIQ